MDNWIKCRDKIIVTLSLSIGRYLIFSSYLYFWKLVYRGGQPAFDTDNRFQRSIRRLSIHLFSHSSPHFRLSLGRRRISYMSSVLTPVERASSNVVAATNRAHEGSVTAATVFLGQSVRAVSFADQVSQVESHVDERWSSNNCKQR